MEEIDKRIEERKISVMSEIITEGFIKEDNIECCVCFEFNYGVKLPNCNHFICPKCYYKLYHHGNVSDDFYNENRKKPVCPSITKPVYPYINNETNLDKIYATLTNNNSYKDWFVGDNEDLYKCIKNNEEFVSYISIEIKNWFVNNENIIKYENDLIQYDLDYKVYEIQHEKYSKELDEYNELLKEERESNLLKSCPLCRQ